ncbi:hypothetical protein PJH52_29305, partial [Mycobacterium kansasii]
MRFTTPAFSLAQIEKSRAIQNVVSLKKSLLELRALRETEDITEQDRERVDLSIERIENGLEYYHWLSRLIDTFESH